MSEIGYKGTYVRFKTSDKDMALGFISADNAVGDHYTIKSTYKNGTRTDWMVNAFNQTMGEVDSSFSDTFDIVLAKGWQYDALLSYVMFTEATDDTQGFYSGELAFIAYDPQYEDCFKLFIDNVSNALADGIRPDLNIGRKGLDEIIKKNKDYLPSGRRPLPKTRKGTAIVKSERSANEKLVSEARKGNRGCVIATWIIYILLGVAVIYGLHILGLF